MSSRQIFKGRGGDDGDSGGGRGNHGNRGGGRGNHGNRGGGRGNYGNNRGGGGNYGNNRGGGDNHGNSRGGGGGGNYRPTNNSIPIPDPAVTKIEDLYQKSLVNPSTKLASLSLGSSSRIYPHRPGYGTEGEKVVLWANYFELRPVASLLLHCYSIEVDPSAVGKRLGQVVRLLIQKLKEWDDQNDLVTDFKSILISRQPVKLASGPFAIRYLAENEAEPRANAQDYQVRVNATVVLTVSELTKYLASIDPNAGCLNELSILQALNILSSYYAKSSSENSTIGSNKAFPSGANAEKINLGIGLEAIRGFFSSVRGAANRILINVNVTHAAFYSPTPLNESIAWFNPDLPSDTFKLEAFLRRLRINPIHFEVGPQRTKVIFGLATTNDGKGQEHPPQVSKHGAAAREVKFFQSSSCPPKYISVYDYFNLQHERPLKFPTLPVVNVGNRENPIYYPAEVCMVIAGQPAGQGPRSSRLDRSQTQEMIKFAVRKPDKNLESIAENGPSILGLLSDPDKKPLERFGVTVGTSLITVHGRVLPAPKVIWNMANYTFNKIAKKSPRWTHVLITTGRNEKGDFGSEQDLLDQMDRFRRVLGNTGVNFNYHRRGYRIKLTNPKDEVENPFSGVEKPFNDGWELLFFILPGGFTHLYNRIKVFGDIKYGVPTICTIMSKFHDNNRNLDSFFGNLSLKFNLKFGGTNQTVTSLVNKSLIDLEKTMVVGMDVTHPSPGSAPNAPSVAAIVASTDKDMAQFPADLRIQQSRQEMVADLSDMMVSRLHLWKKNNKDYPENLLIYRDGVSESQYNDVLEKELPLIRKACIKTYSAPATKKGLPRITIIVVGKRHHTRFYPTKAGDADRSLNPRNGTVVDRGVTAPRNWDFFLQAHAAIQGTARPAHYFVVLDEIFHKPKVQLGAPVRSSADVLEELTHSMCYMFGRATKAVSLCPPAYYADIACERARCYLHQFFESGTSTPSDGPRASDIVIHERLRETMFYI